MKAPRVYARGGYFWISYYIAGRKNDIRKSTGIQLDIAPPSADSGVRIQVSIQGKICRSFRLSSV